MNLLLTNLNIFFCKAMATLTFSELSVMSEF